MPVYHFLQFAMYFLNLQLSFYRDLLFISFINNIFYGALYFVLHFIFKADLYLRQFISYCFISGILYGD